MQKIEAVNEFVIRFANVNGTGSASANHLFAKAIFRMGIPVSPKNIFPSNIQGLPTWYEVRVSEKGFLGRRGGIDISVSVNPQSMAKDYHDVLPGGYFIFDSSKNLPITFTRNDIHVIGLPLTNICIKEYSDPRQRQLFKNIIYVGALSALLSIDFSVLEELVKQQFQGKEKLIAPNIHALKLGFEYAVNNFSCPFSIQVAGVDKVTNKIMIDGNTATALGCVYAGATVAGWYPITPSTSVIEAFEKYCIQLRVNEKTDLNNFAILQAEDELSAIGMVIGACWNGARAFTATSGPGLSLMNEFLGLAYFSEIPAVLVDVQRAGPSTGMPTRTQQSDILNAAYASHGDTKHVLLFPSTPKECFELAAQAFDLAEELQTPVIILSDLDLGMNDHISEPFVWEKSRAYKRGKVLSAQELDAMDKWGRYEDVDGDGIPYRTIPGVHPDKGAAVMRGSSKDVFAVYTESSEAYVDNMDRLIRKFETAKSMVPVPEFYQNKNQSNYGTIFFGTSTDASLEAFKELANKGFTIDALRIVSFPFSQSIDDFIHQHTSVFIIEQNRDAQMKTLLCNECNLEANKLISVLNYDGQPITAKHIVNAIHKEIIPSDKLISLHSSAND
ncbi:MAG: 2-oxoacid:acceptor oxidoreductase subunit alpha [Pseudomonadota bacterium]